jgi:transcriptional regulator with XRE-family HTH domain
MKTNRKAALQTQSEVIRNALKHKGWTQADLARAVEMREYTISRIASGVTLATLDDAVRIAQALGINPDSISQTARRSAPHQWVEGVHPVYCPLDGHNQQKS